MSANPYNITSEDVRNAEAKEAKFNDGKTPKDSDVSAMKQLLSEQESKEDQINRVQANLPLPDQPQAAADLESADASKTDIGSGKVNVKLGTQSSDGLRGPATADSAVRTDGEEWKTNTV